METKKIGWAVLLFGVILGITDYFGIFGFLAMPTEPFSSWILTPLAWSSVALIIIGAFMIKFGRRKPPMQGYQ